MLGCGLHPLLVQGVTKRGAADSKGPDKKQSKVEEGEEGGGTVQKIEDVDTDVSAVQLIGAACKFHKPGELKGGRRAKGKGEEGRGERGGMEEDTGGRRGEGYSCTYVVTGYFTQSHR